MRNLVVALPAERITVYRKDVRFSIVQKGFEVMPHLSDLLEFAVRAAKLAGAAILPHFRAPLQIHNKASGGGFDPVTLADREAELVIRREIARAYPDHGIHGEEHGSEAGASPYAWYIDPIDGTRAFMLGHLHWGTLLALNDGQRPIVGVMHQPYTDETFVGSALGAELRHGSNVRTLRANDKARIGDVLLCATDPTMFRAPALKACFDRLASQVRAVRFGGDCYTPCMLAAGCTDLVVEAGLKPWDVQALVPIVEAAGGVITDWGGRPAATSDKVVIAANPQLHEQVLQALAWNGGA
jgi:histidinol phosphatase-like enzyme (inositol monophosphatase family)